VSLSRRERIDTPRKDIAEVTDRLDRIEKHIPADYGRRIESLEQDLKRLKDALGTLPGLFPYPSPALGGADPQHHTLPVPGASRSPTAAPAVPFSLTPLLNLPTLAPK
jgi:hypothetical protein